MIWQLRIFRKIGGMGCKSFFSRENDKQQQKNLLNLLMKVLSEGTFKIHYSINWYESKPI